MRRTHAGIIVPDKVLTRAAANGRGVLASLLEGIAEARDSGKTVTRVVVSTALQDDLRAFFDYATESFDGVLPRQVRGVPLAYEPGAEKSVCIEYVRH